MSRAPLATLKPLAPSGVHRVLAGAGRPLEPATRTNMESRFAHDFSSVRVHTDADAARSARAVGANAYTVGSRVVFDSGRYAPETAAGQHLLRHELAHVAQHRGERSVVPSVLPVAPDDSAGEQEAHAVARSPRPVTARPGTSAQLHRDPNPDAKPAAAASGPLIAQFDAEEYRGWQHWNLDALTVDLVNWTQSAPGHYVIIQGNHGGEAKDSADPEYSSFEAAKRRAELVKKALEQWAPKLKGRLRAETMGRELIPGGKESMGRQITVWRGGDTAARPAGVLLTPASPTAPGPLAIPGPSAPRGPSPYSPRNRFADLENAVTGIVRDQPDKPGEEKSDFKKFFEAATSKGWDVTRHGDQIVNLSIKGVGRTLFKGDGLEVKGTVGPSFRLDITRGPVVFGGKISLTSGEWSVNLSFPGDTAPPDLATLETVMSRGKAAVLQAGSTLVSPATYSAAEKGDFSTIKDGIAPLVDPISNAVDQVQGFRKAKPGVSFGLAAGSGAGPAGPLPGPEGPKGVFVRGVLNLSF